MTFGRCADRLGERKLRTMRRRADGLDVAISLGVAGCGTGHSGRRMDSGDSSRRYKNAVVKEEGANPTESFKARGLALAVTMAKHYGLKNWPCRRREMRPGVGGVCGGRGMEANIFMPLDVPFANYVEAKMYGANVTLVDGLISDCEG